MKVIFSENGMSLVFAEAGEKWHYNDHALPVTGFWFGSSHSHAYLGGIDRKTFAKVKRIIPDWEARKYFSVTRVCTHCGEPFEVFFKSISTAHTYCAIKEGEKRNKAAQLP